MADSKLTALSALSVPSLEDLAYIVDDPSGTPTSYKATHARMGALYVPGICEGRISLSSSDPVTVGNTSSTTIYWVAYKGNRVSLYDGTRWNLYEIGSSVSLALSGLTADKNYDVYLYDNSGTLTLELSAAWSTDITRTDTLSKQNNIYVKTGATTRRYLGTIRATDATHTVDNEGETSSSVGGKRFVWNYYNRVRRVGAVIDTSTGWTYTTSGWRAANGQSGNKVEFVTGIAEDAASALLQVGFQSSGSAYAMGGIGVDSTATPAGNSAVGLVLGTVYGTFAAQWAYIPDAGYHSVNWIENGLGSGAGLTFIGSNSGFQVSRMMVEVWS